MSLHLLQEPKSQDMKVSVYDKDLFSIKKFLQVYFVWGGLKVSGQDAEQCFDEA